jgi:hypothetical protein
VQYSDLTAKQKVKHVANKSKAEAQLMREENKGLNKELSSSRAEFRTKTCKSDSSA